MADGRFFTQPIALTLKQIADVAGIQLEAAMPENKVFSDVASLSDAGDTHVSFLDNKKYIDMFKSTKAGACFVRPELADLAPKDVIALVSKNPYRAYALAAQAFYPEPVAVSFRAPSAVIDPSAVIASDVYIDHGVVIGKNVKIGTGSFIRAHAVIESGVQIGADCDIGARVYVTHSLIGNKVKIHPGACIGRPGFGFAIDPAGYVAVPQLGRVVIEDDVQIGANTTIDRGAGPDTVIGQGTRIDNLVQIGHNVKIGKYCVIVAQTGISGSTHLGDYVMAGGQSGLAGHLRVGSGAKIAAQSGVIGDLAAGAEVMGMPAIPSKKFLRQMATLSRMIDKKRSRQHDE